MRLHHLAASTALLTFALIVLGSVVHGTGSSLACPDWPLCNGTVFPQMTGGVQFEHSHRILALSVTVLVATMAFRARRRTNTRVRQLAFGALGLVVVQASLGGLTVILRLPPAVSIAHLATSMGVLATLVLLAIESIPGRRPAHGDASSARTLTALAAFGAFAQLVLGALVRHTGAALACASVPACDGAVWPDALLPRIQMVHRAGAIAIAILVFVASWGARSHARRGSAIHYLALAAPAIVVAQIGLGTAVVLSAAPLGLATVHLATGALLLSSLVALWGTLPRPPPVKPSARGAQGFSQSAALLRVELMDEPLVREIRHVAEQGDSV